MHIYNMNVNLIVCIACYERNDCLPLATAEAIDQRVITGYYAKPTNYTSIGVSVGGGHEALLSGNQ